MSEENSKVVLFTTNSMRTSGNISAANKLIISLAHKNPEKTYHWIISCQNPDLIMDYTSSLPSNISVQVVGQFNETDKSILDNSNNQFLMFPEFVGNYEGFESNLPREVRPRVITCYQYDDPVFLENTGKLSSDVVLGRESLPSQRICSGFGENALGVMIQDDTENYNSLSTDMKENDKNQKAMDFLFEESNLDPKEMQKKYLDNHQLYFGYFNASTEGRGMVSASSFSYLAIKDALDNVGDKKVIDIFCKFPTPDILHDGSPYTEMEILLKLLKKNNLYDRVELELLGEFDKKTEKLELPNQASDKVKIRIINGFPITQEFMKYLGNISQPLIGCTGDQSFTEVLLDKKIPLYQVMSWKEGLSNAFFEMLDKVEDCPKLKEFHALQREGIKEKYTDKVTNKRTGNPIFFSDHLNKIASFYHENKDELKKEANILDAYLRKEKSLSNNLLKEINHRYDHNLLLESAIQNNDIESIKQYILEDESRVNSLCNDFYQTPLHLAAKHNNLEAFKFLIEEKNANPNVKDGFNLTSFDYIAKNIDNSLREKLEDFILYSLDLKDVPENYMEKMLWIAVDLGSESILNKLISKNVNIDTIFDGVLVQPSFVTQTALVKSILLNKTDLTELLLKNKADPNLCVTTTNSSRTPLMSACLTKNENLVNKLIQYGAKEDQQAPDGKFAKDFAQGNESILKILQDAQAKPKILTQFKTQIKSTKKENVLDNPVTSKPAKPDL